VCGIRVVATGDHMDLAKLQRNFVRFSPLYSDLIRSYLRMVGSLSFKFVAPITKTSKTMPLIVAAVLLVGDSGIRHGLDALPRSSPAAVLNLFFAGFLSLETPCQEPRFLTTHTMTAILDPPVFCQERVSSGPSRLPYPN